MIPLQSRLKVYVACALTHAPQTFKDDVDLLKAALRPHVEVLDFLGLGAPSAQAAFEWDIQCVKTCDVLVADLSYPSTGLGVEFGVAYATGKPIISLASKRASVSRFVFGYVSPIHFTYRDDLPTDAAEFVLSTLNVLTTVAPDGTPTTLGLMDGE